MPGWSRRILCSAADRQPLPEPFGNQPPEKYQHGVTAVDDDAPFPLFQRPDDSCGDFFGAHQHRVFPFAQQGCVHESGPDVGDADVEPLHP